MCAAVWLLLCVLGACGGAGKRTVDVEQLYQAGYALMIERQYDKACAAYRKALKADATHAQSWSDLSTCLLELGKYGDAAKAARKAAEQYENAALHDDKIGFRDDALVQVGEAYLLQQKDTEARKQFQSVYDLDPENYNTLLNIVVTYIRCGKTAAAAAFCEANTLTQAGNPATLAPLYVLLAQCEDALENADAARAALRNARMYCALAGSSAHDSAMNALAAKLGEVARVSLPSNPTTGFSWDCDIAAPSVAEIAATSYTQDSDEAGVTGSSGTETFVFACKTEGSTALTFTYRRPWDDGETAEVRHATLTVDERLIGTVVFDE